MAVTGWNVTYTLMGVVLVYSGYKGTSLATTVTDLLHGQLDSTDVEGIGSTTSSGSTSASTSTSAYDAATKAGTITAGGTATPSGSFTQADLEALWVANGGSQETASFAAQVANAESSGNPSATSSNPDGGTNVGLWQLDTLGVGSGHTVAELQNPATNAVITIAATGNGVNWQEWSDSFIDAVGTTYTPPNLASPTSGGL